MRKPIAGDELNRPLGLDAPAPTNRRRRSLAIGLGAAAFASVIASGAVFFIASPRGGEPFAVSMIPPPAPKAPLDDRLPTGSIRPPASATAGDASESTATANLGAQANQPGTTVLENGVSVYRAGRPADNRPAAGPLVIKVPEALGQSEILPVDKRLIEQTRYGPVPRIGVDGLRASDRYARPLVFAGPIAPGTPRIALVVGLSAASSDPAIGLPAAISLAFDPYGDDLEKAVARATAKGHEVLLRLPMNDAPGAPPHALASGAGKAETIDNLRWLMSRMTGYVGVTNTDAPFATDKAAMTTMLTEIGGRGLLYIDGATDPRSVGPGLTPALDPPSARADVVLDGHGDQAMQRAALARLEAIARAKGFAIGAIDAPPTDPTAITEFVETLPAKGFVLVPVSALAKTAPEPVATTP